MSSKLFALMGVVVLIVVGGFIYKSGGSLPTWLKTLAPYVAWGGAIILLVFAIASKKVSA